MTQCQLRAGPMADEFRVRCLRAIQRHYIDANRAPIPNTLFSLPYPGHDLTTLDEVVSPGHYPRSARAQEASGVDAPRHVGLHSWLPLLVRL